MLTVQENKQVLKRKVSKQLYNEALDFFSTVTKRNPYKVLPSLLLCYDPNKMDYYLYCPEQEALSCSAVIEVKKDSIKIPQSHKIVAQLFSHGMLSAYLSSHIKERILPGVELVMVFGQTKKPEPSFEAYYIQDGKAEKVSVDDLFEKRDMLHRITWPLEWLNKINNLQ